MVFNFPNIEIMLIDNKMLSYKPFYDIFTLLFSIGFLSLKPNFVFHSNKPVLSKTNSGQNIISIFLHIYIAFFLHHWLVNSTSILLFKSFKKYAKFHYFILKYKSTFPNVWNLYFEFYCNNSRKKFLLLTP